MTIQTLNGIPNSEIYFKGKIALMISKIFLDIYFSPLPHSSYEGDHDRMTNCKGLDIDPTSQLKFVKTI